MNDLNDLLQQIIGMNTAWLQVAVTAQSAFDTIDAAALKTQRVLRNTIADVDGLSKRLVGINGGIQISVNSEQISAAQKEIKQLQSQGEVIKAGNTIRTEGKAEESRTFADKAITTATKSIVKGGITSVIEDKALRTAVKEELATGFRGLVADEAGEFVASSAGGILGDVLGGGVAGTLETALDFLGPEGIAASLVLGASVKIFRNMMEQRQVHYPANAFVIEAGKPVRYTDNSKGLPHIENYKRKDPSILASRIVTDYSGSYQKHFDPATKDFVRTTLTSDTVDTYDPIYAPTPLKGPTDLIGPKQIMLNSMRATIENLKKEYPTRGFDYIGEQVEDIRQNIDSLDKGYLLSHPKEKISPYRKLFNEGTAELNNFIFENNIERNGGKKKKNYSGTAPEVQSEVGGGKVINININKAFIENFSIHAQNIQQGYDGLKQKVEEIFLEILNSANAIQN